MFIQAGSIRWRGHNSSLTLPHVASKVKSIDTSQIAKQPWSKHFEAIFRYVLLVLFLYAFAFMLNLQYSCVHSQRQVAVNQLCTMQREALGWCQCLTRFYSSSYSFTRQSSGFLVGYTRRLSGRTDVKWLFLMHRLCNAQTVLSSLCSGYADDICGQTACGEPKTIQRFLPGIVSKCFKASVCFSVVPSSPAI